MKPCDKCQLLHVTLLLPVYYAAPLKPMHKPMHNHASKQSANVLRPQSKDAALLGETVGAYLWEVIFHHVLGQSRHFGSVLRVSCIEMDEQRGNDTAQNQPHGCPRQQGEHGHPDIYHCLWILHTIAYNTGIGLLWFA